MIQPNETTDLLDTMQEVDEEEEEDEETEEEEEDDDEEEEEDDDNEIECTQVNNAHEAEPPDKLVSNLNDLQVPIKASKVINISPYNKRYKCRPSLNNIFEMD